MFHSNNFIYQEVQSTGSSHNGTSADSKQLKDKKLRNQCEKNISKESLLKYEDVCDSSSDDDDFDTQIFYMCCVFFLVCCVYVSCNRFIFYYGT